MVGFALTETTNQTKSEFLQEKNRTFSEFIKRTDQLAHRLGKNVSELPEKLKISKSMLYAYRTGKTPISPKAWVKLEDLEAYAGCGSAEKSDFVRSYGKPYEFDPDLRESVSSQVREDEVPYRFTGKDQEVLQRNGLSDVLERIATALEKLVEIEERKK